MPTFGKLLKSYRLRAKMTGGVKLTQTALADALREELGLRDGYSAQTISQWERDRNQPIKDDLHVIHSLVAVLYRYGGIVNLNEVEQFLEAGSYRSFDRAQLIQLEPLWVDDVKTPALPIPYIGLRAFQEDEAPNFFGRKLAAQRLTDLIQHNQTVLLVGAAGSGKSSLVQAGMLPLLRQSAEWQIVTIPEKNSVFYALAAAFSPLLENSSNATERLGHVEQLADALQTGHVTLAATIQTLPQPLLLIFEDWDQLYQHSTPDDQLRLLSMLTTAAQTYPMLRFLFVVRTTHQMPAWLLSGVIMRLTPPLRRDLQAMIIEPAKAQQIEIEPQLVTHLLDKLEGQPSALLLLAQVMRCLWDQRQGPKLTFAEYLNLEAVEGMIVTYADKVYETLSAEKQRLARQTFLQLVHSVDQQTFTPQDVPQQYFKPEEADLICQLADARLLVITQDASNQVVIRLSYTPLAQQWWRLRQWIGEAEPFWEQQRQLRIALRQWEDAGRDELLLLQGDLLQRALALRGEPGGLLGQTETRFIEASETYQQRRLQRMRLGFLLLGLLAGICLIGAVVWSRIAEANAHLQDAQVLLDDGHYAAALSKGAQAVAVRDSAEMNAQLADIWQQSPQIVAYLETDSADFTDFVLLSDTLIAAHWDGTLSFWDTTHYNTIQQIRSPHIQAISNMASAPDERTFATGGNDGSLALWQAQASQPYREMNAHGGTVRALAFFPHHPLLATGGADGWVHFWDINSGQLAEGGFDVGDIVQDMAFAADGTLHIATQSRQQLRWRDGVLETTPRAGVLSSIVPFDDAVIVGDTMGTMIHPAVPIPIDTALAQLHALAVAADHSLLAAGGCLTQSQGSSRCAAGGIHVWSANQPDRELYKVVVGLTGLVKSVAFSADGERLFALTPRQIVVLQNSRPPTPNGYTEWEELVCALTGCPSD